MEQVRIYVHHEGKLGRIRRTVELGDEVGEVEGPRRRGTAINMVGGGWRQGAVT